MNSSKIPNDYKHCINTKKEPKRKPKKGSFKGYTKSLELRIKQLEARLQQKLEVLPASLRNDCLKLLNSKIGAENKEIQAVWVKRKKHKTLVFPQFDTKYDFAFSVNSNYSAYVGETCVHYLLAEREIGKPSEFVCKQLGKFKTFQTADNIESRLTKDVLHYVIQKYLKNFHEYFPIVEKESMRETANNLTNLRSKDSNRFLLYGVIAATFSNKDCNVEISGVNIGKLCCDCYETLTDNVIYISMKPTIINIQILLHYILAKNPRNRQRIWSHSCTLVEMALLLNLNDEEYVKRSTQSCLLKNIWWTCYTVDVFVSLFFGRPYIIKGYMHNTNELTFTDRSCRSQENISISVYLSSSVFCCELHSLYLDKISEIAIIMKGIIGSLYLNMHSVSDDLHFKKIFDDSENMLEKWYGKLSEINTLFESQCCISGKMYDLLVYFHVCKVLLYKKFYNYELKTTLKTQYLKTMLDHANNIKNLTHEHEDVFIDSAAIYKTYPLYICVYIYTTILESSGELCKESEAVYKAYLFDVLRMLQNYGLQSYFTKWLIRDVIKRLSKSRLYLSTLHHIPDLPGSKEIFGEIAKYES